MAKEFAFIVHYIQPPTGSTRNKTRLKLVPFSTVISPNLNHDFMLSFVEYDRSYETNNIRETIVTKSD